MPEESPRLPQDLQEILLQAQSDIDLGNIGEGVSITNSCDTFAGDGTTEGANTIAGILNSHPNQTFTIELFSNPSGTDEGKTLVGQNSVTTDIGGDASFGLRVSRSKASAGAAITATATDAERNTSEFSAAKQVG
jgi:hypothetical protein